MENIGETPQKMRDNLNFAEWPDFWRSNSVIIRRWKAEIDDSLYFGYGAKRPFLDEPLANMDRRSATQLLTLLKRCLKMKTTPSL